MNIKIDQSDLTQLKKKLDNLRSFDKSTLSKELGTAGLDIARIAKKAAPVFKGSGGGTLRQSIKSEKKGKTVEVIAGAKYAPYVEFGTGAKAYIPPDFKEMAAQFKGATGESWEKGLAEITRWCIKKGIPESAAYPIFMSILKNGIYASPFLWPAFKFGRAELVDRLENVIKEFNLQ